MKYFAGMLAAVVLVAAVTTGAYRLWDNATSTRGEDNGGILNATPASTIPPSQKAPAEGSVVVAGTVTAVHLEGAVLPPLSTPFTVTTPERGFGAGATITGIQVRGNASAVEWDAGTPLPVSGDGGALMLAPVTVDAGPDGATVLLDTAKDHPHGFTPGTYRVDAPVAVGTGSLAQPVDSTSFTATANSHVEFRGTATTGVPNESLADVSGQGALTLTGQLTIVHPDRTTTAATSITLDAGSYEVALTPLAGGYSVIASITGPVH